MRLVMWWILILQTLHLPIPFPDLDGECRGKPIRSLFDASAWHVVVLGVCPNKDVDHGPFRTGDQNDATPPAGSPFGQPGTSPILASAATQTFVDLTLPEFRSHSLFSHHCNDPSVGRCQSQTDDEWSPHLQASCALRCVWLI